MFTTTKYDQLFSTTITNILLLAACIIAAGCGLDSNNEDEDQPDPVQVTTTDTQDHGTVLSDGDGNVLYFFTRDVGGESNCTGECLQNWPVFAAESVSPQAGLDPTNFANTQRADGSTQTTFKGWPLYYFSNDEAPGEVNGDGINDVWYVAKSNYTMMVADAQLVGNDDNNYIIDDNGDYVQGEGMTTFFTDSEGRTLYAFVNDKYNTNNYTNEDFSNDDAWPIYYEEIDALPSGINENEIDVIDVHGEQQLTYKGWPLYYFGQDQNPGETKGVSVPQPGVWPIVNNDIQEAPQPDPTVVQTTTTQSHGEVLSDGDGNVLYFFTRDVAGESNCSGECLQNWPTFTADEVNSSSGLDPANFSTIERADGSSQTTYKGWPLYYFANDNAAGEVNGDGAGDVWYVAKASYTLMIADGQLVGNDGNNYTSNYEQGEEITTYFTDSEGRTLYAFVNDEYNTNNYTNDDFSNNDAWPVFYEEIDALPSALDEGNFDVIDVHGEQQLTYKGWPLYYFGQDQERGETKGVSVPEPGVWPVINTDLEEAPQPSS